MSSLAATQADGYYVPSQYVDANKGKQFRRKANGKGHSAYLQGGVVRFELPYKGICISCKCSIGRGTRYNAQKKDANEKYFTTTIYEFTMKCRNDGCSQTFVIRTNPKERGFDYCSGITLQKGQELQLHGAAAVDGATGQQSIGVSSTASMQIHDMCNGDIVVASSSLDRLEKQVAGQRKLLSVEDHLDKLEKWNQETTLRDADRNAEIRKQFRKDRKAKKQRLKDASSRGWKSGMEVMDTSTRYDILKSKTTVFGASSKIKQQKQWSKVRSTSIFSSPSTSRRSKRQRVEQRRARNTNGHGDDSTAPPVTVSSSSTSRSRLAVSMRPAGLDEAVHPDIVHSQVNDMRTEAEVEADPDHRRCATTTKGKSKRRIQVSVGSQLRVTQDTPARKPSPKVHGNAVSNLLKGYGSDSSSDD